MQYAVFFPLVLAVPEAAIMRRLGMASRTTVLSGVSRKELCGHIARAAAMLSLRAAYARLVIARWEPARIVLADGSCLRSVAVAEFLKGCREVLFMGVTAGSDITAEIRVLQVQQMSQAVVYDATASEMVDGALTWLLRQARVRLRPQGLALSRRRFSCGYADFALSHQELFMRVLRMSEWGVRLNDHWMFEPEKTVTALAGISAVTESVGGNRE